MMNLDTMNRDELIGLYLKLEQKLGWYSITLLEVEQVRQQLQERGTRPLPSDDEIHRACAYVSRKHSDDCLHLVEWAADLADDNAKAVQA